MTPVVNFPPKIGYLRLQKVSSVQHDTLAYSFITSNLLPDFSAARKPTSGPPKLHLGIALRRLLAAKPVLLPIPTPHRPLATTGLSETVVSR